MSTGRPTFRPFGGSVGCHAMSATTSTSTTTSTAPQTSTSTSTKTLTTIPIISSSRQVQGVII
ncbi:hypothetical protein EXIGLDRAFT_65275 [Exidia glandulosa HHB12029]|uniref:Uncharacterized protein n=1 Tax=Exidia glandulosa HHB12029 TaxID=1314781 RepID=A0A165P2B2_EXIGL|nr:hypothetical protein EXIGLDRAFT_65275 [Exidia glandulosa HHB12029]